MMKLDARDLQILSVLAREGRITKADLARRVNLSATPCWERLQRLERAGVISGYHAEIALKTIAPHVVVFVTVELLAHRGSDFAAFEAAVSRVDEVTACWALGGGVDYLMQVITRDIDSYQRLMDRLLDARVGVGRYVTYVMTKPVKAPAPPPLAALLRGAEDPPV